MTWFDYFLLVWWTLGTIAVVATIGRRRPPVTPGAAAVLVLINVMLGVGLIATR